MKISLNKLKEGYLDYPIYIRWVITLVCIGIYVLLDPYSLPEIRIINVIPFQIRFSMILIPIIAVFLGPIFGLATGLFGSLASDIINAHTVVAFGLTNLSLGLIGLVVGLPNYKRWKNLLEDGAMLRMVSYSFIGIMVSLLVYSLALIVVVKQNATVTILYNILPYIGQVVLTIMIISPVIIAILDYLLKKS